MKNKYEVRGEVTVIFVKSKVHGEHEILIDTDDLDRLKKLNAKWHVNRNKGKKTLYSYTRVREADGKIKLLAIHRFIMNPDDGLIVDHINHNGLDNRKENLRIGTVAQNNQNIRGAKKNSKTGIRGVSYEPERNKYRVHVVVNGKSIIDKRYDTLFEAEVISKAAREKFMEFSTN